MGRKIPGKKHRGVRDPLAQKAAREEKLKNIINAPPANPNDQEIPKSLENIMRFKKLVKESPLSSVRKEKKECKSKLVRVDKSRFLTKEIKFPDMKKPDRPMPSLVQWIGETDDNFLKRVDEVTQSVISEFEFEQQFGIRVKHDKDGEASGIEMAKPDELEMLAKQNLLLADKRRQKKLKDFKKSSVKPDECHSDGQILNSKQRKKMKLLAKRQERMLENEEKFKFKDPIEFGEVIHRPPELTVRPKNATSSINKPGMRGNLLLQKMFIDNKLDSGKIRRSNLSPAARKLLDEQRNNAVQLYRQMKLNKNATKKV